MNRYGTHAYVLRRRRTRLQRSGLSENDRGGKDGCDGVRRVVVTARSYYVVGPTLVPPLRDTFSRGSTVGQNARFIFLLSSLRLPPRP